MAHGVQGSGVLGPGPDAPQTLFQGQGAGATRGHRWNQRRTGEFWVENAGEKVKKNGKKTSFERIKMDFPADWIEKIGECSRNGFEPICSYEFTIVFPIFGRKSQARHQQYRESPMQEMPGTQWVKTFGTPIPLVP